MPQDQDNDNGAGVVRQAPTPGPLSGDDVKLLVKGDKLLTRQGILLTFEYADKHDFLFCTGFGGEHDLDAHYYEAYSFIGRPDADGWMPWSGGENPVPGQMVEIVLRGDDMPDPYNAGLSGIVEWDHTGKKGDIVAFRLVSDRETVLDAEANDLVQTAQALAIAIERVPDWLMNDNLLTAHCHAEVLIADLSEASRLAPTAPVEASGSEREIALGQFQPFSDFPDLAAHIERMGATGQLGSLTDWDAFLATLNAAVSNKEGHIPPINAATVIAYEDAHAVAVEMGYPSLTEALEHLSELRPQPSGETREAVARVEALIEDLTYAAMPTKPDVVTLCGSTASQARDDLRAILALLSARPLALGGQQGEVDGDKVEMIADLIEKYTYVMSKHNPDMARVAGLNSCAQHILAALSATPARAEAQDEQPDITPYTEDLKGLKAAMQAEAQDEGGEPVTLAECPPGLFLWNGTLGFKSEYGAMEPIGSNFKTWKVGSRADAYCADSGEYFWGGTSNHADRDKVLVMPIDAALAHPSPTPAADADRVRAWDAFAAHSNWELSHGYPDGEEEDGCWLVHSVNGGRNDREWTLIGRGETPLDAALAALKSEGK